MTYALEGAVFIAGAAVQWVRDGLKAIQSSAEVEQLAATVDDADGVYLVPAFVGLGAPYWDPYARGLIIGLTRNTAMGHIARATVDSMAYQTRDVLDADAAGGRPAALGAARWTAARPPTTRCCSSRPTSSTCRFGGRSLPRRPRSAPRIWRASRSATGTGPDDVTNNWALDREFAPAMEAPRRERLYRGWKKAASRSLDWEEPAM